MGRAEDTARPTGRRSLGRVADGAATSKRQSVKACPTELPRRLPFRTGVLDQDYPQERLDTGPESTNLKGYLELNMEPG